MQKKSLNRASRAVYVSAFKMQLVLITIIAKNSISPAETALSGDADSSEQNLQLYDSDRQRNPHEDSDSGNFLDKDVENFDKENGISHFDKDAACDCNSQGPWRPLFKPSEQIGTEFKENNAFNEELSNSLEHNLHDDRFPELPAVNGFHNADGNLRRGKKQNHMIHLHLIPHLYMPVVHPISYSSVSAGGVSSFDPQHTSYHSDGSSEQLKHQQPSPIINDLLLIPPTVEKIPTGNSHEVEEDDHHQPPPPPPGEQSLYPTQPSAEYGIDNSLQIGEHSNEDSGFVQETPDEIIHSHFREHQLSDQYRPLPPPFVANNFHHHSFRPEQQIFPYQRPLFPAQSGPLLHNDLLNRHQYQVHEDDVSKEFNSFENYDATSSNVDQHILPVPTNSSRLLYTFNNNNNNNNNNNKQTNDDIVISSFIQKNKGENLIKHGKKPVFRITATNSNRNVYGQKLLNLLTGEDKGQLTYMKPPALGQKETWSRSGTRKTKTLYIPLSQHPFNEQHKFNQGINNKKLLIPLSSLTTPLEKNPNYLNRLVLDPNESSRRGPLLKEDNLLSNKKIIKPFLLF